MVTWSLTRLIKLFVAIGALAVIDVVFDAEGGLTWEHVAFEGGTIALAAGGIALVTARLREERARTAAEMDSLRSRGDALADEAARWRTASESAARNFADVMESEFDRWQLTEAERDVAVLVLKGMSLKEIAAARGTSERTVRQQASVVYGKAGVAGRNELASWFLDALPVRRSSAG